MCGHLVPRPFKISVDKETPRLIPHRAQQVARIAGRSPGDNAANAAPIRAIPIRISACLFTVVPFLVILVLEGIPRSEIISVFPSGGFFTFGVCLCPCGVWRLSIRGLKLSGIVPKESEMLFP